jgi:hypothetical protein
MAYEMSLDLLDNDYSDLIHKVSVVFNLNKLKASCVGRRKLLVSSDKEDSKIFSVYLTPNDDMLEVRQAFVKLHNDNTFTVLIFLDDGDYLKSYKTDLPLEAL